MSLGQFINITDFWHKKSIKLSDAFEVLITLNNNQQPLVNCTGFTIPKLEYEEETLEYGNVSQVFVTPKYDSCKELILDFYEYMDDKNKNYSCTLKKVFDYMGYKLNQKYSNGLMTNYGVYNIDKVIPAIDIKILNNNLWRYKFLYHFENLKIVNYTVYNLDYQNESPCKVTVTLSFETYYRQSIDKEVEYGETTETKQITPTDPIYDPNGKVNYGEANINGQAYSNREDIEQNWKQSINQTDLDMIKEEQLYKPGYEELPDLDDAVITPEIQNEMWKQAANDKDLDMIRYPELAELEDLEISTPNNSNPPIETKPEVQVAEKPKEQKKKVENSYTKSEIKEMAQRAAQFDKQTGVKKGNTGTYYMAGLNAMGLNASDRKDFEAAYQANM